ncbi:MAG TPA: pyridine nucleotide-disulfide oxidoreductase, partial [Clostridiales bacterium]|nr:pyridine nucleotide-disulfide oxidoreductase [Clostridiales bacterium]
NTPNMSRSAYVAHVDSKNCVACGKCVEYCPAGAVKLGQKLCTKHGEIKYPKHELPDALCWGKDKWDEDYRDKNRINCYDTGTAPCKANCPAHIAVQGYLKLAHEGKYKEALKLIKKDNPLPAICGRICNKKCEDACTRGIIDEPVSIDEVKRFVSELDLNKETRVVPKVVIPSGCRDHFDEKIAIIGAGPAGLSCAYYLAEKGYFPVVFEKNKFPGGMLTYGIPSYKLEKDVIYAEVDVLKEMGVEFRYGVEVGKDITIDELRKEGFTGFYIAIGCQGGRYPGIINEKANGCITAVKFLHDVSINRNLTLDGDVVIIGGGNVAIDAARTSTRLTKGKVKMFSLETRDIMPASDDEINEALDENVDINCGWGPKEVKTDDNNNVTSIVLKKCIRVYDENHKFAPVYDENDIREVPCKNIIFSIGQSIEWNNLLKGTNVKFNRNGTPIADKLTYQTDERDIFVGGDVYTGPSFAINAIAQGKEGAISLHRFVQINSSLTIGRNRRDFISLNKDDLNILEYDKTPRTKIHLNENIDYKHSFKDARILMSEKEVQQETSRCLSCGASVVDENKCIGCGICTTKCEFDAIHLSRDLPEASNLVKSEDKFKVI